MKIQVETVSPVERKVTIEVDPDRVARELEKSYVGLGQRVKLKGFRPGKTPRKVLERHFKGEVEGEVLDRIVQQTFAEAMKVESIPAIAPPHVSVTEGVAEGKPLRYTARVEVKPKVEPKDWRGLEVQRREPQVSDADVQAELQKLQDSLAQLAPVEGRFDAQEGDWAEIDHDGTIDGKPFEGSAAQGVTVQIAQGSIAEGNLAALAGKRLGETLELDERFADDHRNPALRGKVAHMKVTLKALKQRQAPPLDDALAKGLGMEGVETLDALRERIRADLEKREKRKAEAEFKDAIVKAALAKNEFEVPPALVERAIDGMLEGATERFARSGIDIRKLELDFSRMRADLREQALTQVRGALLLEALADAEQIEVTEEDLQAEAAKIAEEMGVPLARVQQQLRGAEPRAALKSRVREEKAVALLAAVASIKA